MKACLRCGGGIVRESDQFGAYEHCLMCGRVVDDTTPDTEDPARLWELWDDQLEDELASRAKARRKARRQQPDVQARRRKRDRALRRRKREGGTG